MRIATRVGGKKMAFSTKNGGILARLWPFFLYIFQNNYGKDMHVESGIVECRLCPFSLFYQIVKKPAPFETHVF